MLAFFEPGLPDFTQGLPPFGAGAAPRGAPLGLRRDERVGGESAYAAAAAALYLMTRKQGRR